jgi:hypothetical protein
MLTPAQFGCTVPAPRLRWPVPRPHVDRAAARIEQSAAGEPRIGFRKRHVPLRRGDDWARDAAARRKGGSRKRLCAPGMPHARTRPPGFGAATWLTADELRASGKLRWTCSALGNCRRHPALARIDCYRRVLRCCCCVLLVLSRSETVRTHSDHGDPILPITLCWVTERGRSCTDALTFVAGVFSQQNGFPR